MIKKNIIKGIPKAIPLYRIEWLFLPSRDEITVRKSIGDTYAHASIGCHGEYTISDWLNDSYHEQDARDSGYSEKDIKEYKRILLWVAKALGETVKVKKPAKKKKPVTKKKAVKKRR